MIYFSWLALFETWRYIWGGGGGGGGWIGWGLNSNIINDNNTLILLMLPNLVSLWSRRLSFFFYLPAIIVTDRETHKSRGFGYVVFSNPEDAKEAISTMAGERGKVCILMIEFL